MAPGQSLPHGTVVLAVLAPTNGPSGSTYPGLTVSLTITVVEDGSPLPPLPSPGSPAVITPQVGRARPF
jgi:hypothetical protein